MAQAECITTAIRQLMSRERPPKSTSPVRQAHTNLIALAGNVPHAVYAGANADDLNTRAYRLAGGALDHRYLDNVFQDLSADAVRVIRTAAEEVGKDENWRAP
jgi:hypothetical protein